MKGQQLSRCRWLAFVVISIMLSCSNPTSDINQQDDLLEADLKSSSENSENDLYQCSPRYFDDDLLDQPCELTDFGFIISDYLNSFVGDEVFYDDQDHFNFNIVEQFLFLNREYVTHYRGPVYFGDAGQYTNIVRNVRRKLEKFWKLNHEVVINAQHIGDLNDRETLADMIESFDEDVPNREESYRRADHLLQLSSRSENLPESPFFAMEAFSKTNGLIVIGDGLIETFALMDIDEKLAYKAVLSHEWWHQVQTDHPEWKSILDFNSYPAYSKYVELQADFASAYYLTHKKGEAANWREVENFFKISYNIGDCLPESSAHHGSPAERQDAARMGYDLANDARRKGKVLSENEIYNYFNDNY